MYNLTIETAPTGEVVSLGRAKSHLRIEATETHEDPFITDLIDEAVSHIESEAGITILTTAYILTLDRFPKRVDDPIYLPRPPLVSVEEVAYIDENGANQTLDNVQVSIGDLSGLFLDFGACWPATRRRKKAVTIKYTSGQASCPPVIRRAILLLVGHWFNHREGQPIPTAIEDLIESFRPGDDWERPDGQAGATSQAA